MSSGFRRRNSSSISESGLGARAATRRVVEISTIEGAFFSTRSAKLGNSAATRVLEKLDKAPENRQRQANPARVLKPAENIR